MKLNKVGILIIILITMLFYGCSDSISTEDYAQDYYKIFSDMEQLVSETIIFESSDLIDVRVFRVEYSHEDYIHYIDEYVNQIDDALYQLSVLGPKLEDKELMKYQSKLELAYNRLMTTLKLYREYPNFNTNVVNNYSFYDDMYHMLSDMAPDMIKIYRNEMAIEMRLSALGYPAEQSYSNQKYMNIQSWNYIYAVLAGQVSAYQDYSGLQVHPGFPAAIENSDGHWYSTCEMDFNIMLSTSDDLREYMTLSDEMIVNYELNKEDYFFYEDFLSNYLDTYESYALIRSEHPYDFFKKGMFKEYQIRNGTFNISDPLHQFDVIYEEEFRFLEMTQYFMELISYSFNNNHDRYLLHQE